MQVVGWNYTHPALGQFELIRKSQSICVVGHYEHFVRQPSHCLQIMWAHTTVLRNSPLCAWWADTSYLSHITVHEMGPCKWLGAITFTLLWANSSSSGRASAFVWWATTSISFSSHPTACKSYGPTQQPCVLARYVLGGPTRATCRILQCMKWARANG